MTERRYHSVREIMRTFAPDRPEAEGAAVDKLVREFSERLRGDAQTAAAVVPGERTSETPIRQHRS
jgi:hypothetical protein